jgi:quercetin dioxygenase-like cupin family protein
MFVKSIEDIASLVIEGPGANNVVKRVLIGPEQGWQGWVMRLFTLGPGGHSPSHAHPWPHIVFVHAGQGTITVDGEDHPVAAGYAAVVPGNLHHQFAHRGEGEFSFVCIVPEEGDV